MAETRSGKRKAPTEEYEEFKEARHGGKPKVLAEENNEARLAPIPEHAQEFLDWLKGEWTCPITYALLVDPVEAEDGKHYERAAIEEYFATQPSGLTCLSPMTRTVIGKRLVPATWMVEAILKMVKAHLVDEESGKAWAKARKDMAQVRVLKSKAEAGDANAMGRLAFSYRDGTRGLKKDAAEAFKWFKKAADLRDGPAATSCAIAYLNGSGVERNQSRGLSMLMFAAMLGSEHACSVLGYANENGYYGFEKDASEASRWYKEMKQCKYLDSVEPYRIRAARWLSAHP